MNSILFYTGNEQKCAEVAALCEKSGLPFRRIRGVDLNRRIGEMVFDPEPFDAAAFALQANVRLPEIEKTPALYNMPEILVMANMKGTEMEQFMADYRNAKIPPVPLKAALTPNNVLWTPYTLSKHLAAEHEKMTRAVEETKKNR